MSETTGGCKIMNCPDCDGEMESEKKEGLDIGTLGRGAEHKNWLIEYFCIQCSGYWTWRRGSPLQRVGAPSNDPLDRYKSIAVDDAGHVW